MKRSIVFGMSIISFAFQFLFAQSLSAIKYFQIEGLSSKDKKEVISNWKKLKSVEEIKLENATWYNYFFQQGKQEIQLDTLFLKKDSLFASIYVGKVYCIHSLEIKNLSPNYQTQIAAIKDKKVLVPLDWKKIEGTLQNIVVAYQNEGYPFARFYNLNIDYEAKADSILTDISYQFETGNLYKMDSINMQGKVRESPKLLYAMLRIRPESKYNQMNIDNIPRVLNNSIYYQNVKPAIVTYTSDGKANLTIPFQKRRTNQFDALVGILPPLSTDVDRRFQFTGMLNVSLVSMFKQGEALQFKYEKLPLTAQRIEGKFAYPYMLGSAFHVGAEGNLYQQSVEFTNIQGKAEAKYQFSPFLLANLYYRKRQTILSDSLIRMVYVHKTRTLLTALSSNSNLYGTGLTFEKLDYKQVPTRGISFELETAIGQKIIKKNPAMLTIRPTFYDSIPEKQILVEANLQLKAYYRIKKRSVFHISNHTYWLNQTLILPSDQMRLGGSKTLRGFNENQFYADKFSTFTAEYRFLLDAKSFLQAFVDYGYLYDSVRNEANQATGLGLGMTYNIPLGMLSISYAVGKYNDQSFQFGRGRIHIGITNEF